MSLSKIVVVSVLALWTTAFWFWVFRSAFCLCFYRPDIPPEARPVLFLGLALFLISCWNIIEEDDQ